MTSREWTPEDFQTWLRKHSDPIKDGQDQRRRAIEHAVIEYARKAIRDWRMTLNAAGDDLLRRHPYGPGNGVASCPAETRAALLAIGWVPPRQRRKGGAE